MKPSAKYNALADRVLALMKHWIEIESRTRAPDLRFHEWGATVYAGPLTGRALDALCDSPDARRLCEWIDVQTKHEATLLMAYVACEMLGLKPSTFQPGN